MVLVSLRAGKPSPPVVPRGLRQREAHFGGGHLSNTDCPTTNDNDNNDNNNINNNDSHNSNNDNQGEPLV